jgi:hypothetical protein
MFQKDSSGIRYYKNEEGRFSPETMDVRRAVC